MFKLTSLFLVLCLLQMTPWIGEILFLHYSNRASEWIWWVGALISISAIGMIIKRTNSRGLMAIGWGLSGWHKRTVLYCFLLGLISYGIVFLLRLAIGGLEITGVAPSAQLFITLTKCLFMTFYIAFSEEIIFRGFVY